MSNMFGNGRASITKADRFDRMITLQSKTLRVVPDEGNPGRHLVAFKYDATSTGSISLKFFAKEDTDGQEGFLSPITVDVEQGLAHEYKQRSGTGIDISTLEINHGVNPLEIWMEVSSGNKSGGSCPNFQINYVTFEMDNGEYTPRVQKQITVVDGQKWEIHDTYESELCAICFDAPANVIIIPCGHKCICITCVEKMIRSTEVDKCPLCRKDVVEYA